MNNTGELILPMLEDQLLDIANRGDLISVSETTSNLHTFLIKVNTEYHEIAIKAPKCNP